MPPGALLTFALSRKAVRAAAAFKSRAAELMRGPPPPGGGGVLGESAVSLLGWRGVWCDAFSLFFCGVVGGVGVEKY